MDFLHHLCGPQIRMHFKVAPVVVSAQVLLGCPCGSLVVELQVISRQRLSFCPALLSWTYFRLMALFGAVMAQWLVQIPSGVVANTISARREPLTPHA